MREGGGEVLRFDGVGISETGLVREHNEDSGFMGPYVALVADGVGGAAAGEVASSTATYVVSAQALAHPAADPAHLVRAAFAAAQLSLAQGVRSDVGRAGMATTLTALVTDGRRVVLAHIGDSRAYRYSDGRLTKLSTDHTYVQKLVDEGSLAGTDAHRHPWRHVVLRSLHADPALHVHDLDVTELDCRPGDRFLLCTDGLTDLVPEDAIAEILGLADPRSAAARLVAEAMAAGGVDNVTCIVTDVVDGPRVVGDGALLGAVRDLRNVVDAAAVRLP